LNKYHCIKQCIVVKAVDRRAEFPSLDWARQYALKELVPQEINFVVSDGDTGQIYMDVRFGSHTKNP